MIRFSIDGKRIIQTKDSIENGNYIGVSEQEDGTRWTEYTKEHKFIMSIGV